MASELTAGYDSFSNLQLYRVNGIPILNLKHLCHVLDKLTVPHMSKKNGSANTSEILAMDVGEKLTIQPAEVADDSNSIGRNSPNLDCSNGVTVSQREKDSYTNFDAMKEETAEERERNADNINETEERKKQQHALIENDILYSEFTTKTQNLYYGAGDDPLLLDCTNFIHFELDKDKVVVFDIASAYIKNPEILSQYAISSSRADSLPKQQY